MSDFLFQRVLKTAYLGTQTSADHIMPQFAQLASDAARQETQLQHLLMIADSVKGLLKEIGPKSSDAAKQLTDDLAGLKGIKKNTFCGCCGDVSTTTVCERCQELQPYTELTDGDYDFIEEYEMEE